MQWNMVMLMESWLFDNITSHDLATLFYSIKAIENQHKCLEIHWGNKLVFNTEWEAYFKRLQQGNHLSIISSSLYL